MNRKSQWVVVLGALLLVSLGVNLFFFLGSGRFSSMSLSKAAAIIGLEFTASEKRLMKDDVAANLESYQSLRDLDIDNGVPPALGFQPWVGGREIFRGRDFFRPTQVNYLKAPENLEEVAFWPVIHLAHLIRTRQVTSTELTKMYLARLKKYGPKLECVITLTEDLALEQAARADREIAAGRYRGPLHGIPWGAKDLLTVKGYPTTWGAEPYRLQEFDEDAAVVKKLEEAGAVLVAKLTLGALAWGDVWFDGVTKNPWDLEQGSSGSSAGSASATSAGLVGFAIGTETWGSIVSPSTRCGVTGLRPTFGRVSRTGAMALSWSMDKIGPICRNVEDCALVFHAIHGSDGQDPVAVDAPFRWDAGFDWTSLRIGYLKSAFDEEYDNQGRDRAVLDKLKELGAELVPIELPDYPVYSLSFILNAEGAAAFDELTRSGDDDLMVRQGRNAWPNVFRYSRLIPAVEYIQANRVRYQIMQDMKKLFEKVDVYVAPSFGGGNLLVTNLTGHPAVVLPNGFDEEGHPTSITFTGDLFQDSDVLAVAKAYQDATEWHLKHPVIE